MPVAGDNDGQAITVGTLEAALGNLYDTTRHAFINKESPPHIQLFQAHERVLGCCPTGHYAGRVSPYRAQKIDMRKSEFEDWDVVWEVDAEVADNAAEIDRLSSDTRNMLLHLVPWHRENPMHDPSTHNISTTTLRFTQDHWPTVYYRQRFSNTFDVVVDNRMSEQQLQANQRTQQILRQINRRQNQGR